MHRKAILVLVMSIVLSSGCSALAAERAPTPPVSVTVEGKDGTRLLGTVNASTLEMDAISVGRVGVPWREVRTLEFGADGETVTVICRHGDVLQGVPDLDGFVVETDSGKFAVDSGNVTRIDISPDVFNLLPIVFESHYDAMDWGTSQAISAPKVTDGALTFEVTGHDPWLVRSQLEIPAADCPALVIRMKKSAGKNGQVYWITNRSGQWTDDRRLDYETAPDGQFHDVFIPVGRHPGWKGTITALRIDPDSDDALCEVAIESIRSADDDAPTGPGDDNEISVLDGRRFIAREPWVNKVARSAGYSHGITADAAVFNVPEPDRNMKWSHCFYSGVDTKKYPYLELRYRAENVRTDSDDYVLWLFDRRPFHAAGFEAVIAREIVADGKPHTLRLPLARFNPAGPIVEAAVRVASGERGAAKFIIERLAFTRTLRGEGRVSLLDGRAFEPVGQWVKDAHRSTDFRASAEQGFGEYRVNDAHSEMKWIRRLDTPLDVKQYPVLEMTYRATGLRESDDGGCILWLGTPHKGNWGGFEAVMAREIISDGKPHTVQVRMARFNPAGPVERVLIRVPSGDEGPAVFTIDQLDFLPNGR